MLISHETPVSLLPYSWSYNDYDYCLVHLLPSNKKYKDFYFKSVQSGRKVLLDNSIFELGTSFEPNEFAKWVRELKPYEYVIPDVLEEAEDTCVSLQAFTETFPDLPGRKIGVVQGKTYKELCECYKFIAPLVDKIAISFDYSYYLEHYETVEIDGATLLKTDLNLPSYISKIPLNDWTKYALGRVKLINDFYNDDILDIEKPHHLLGCSVPWEFDIYKLNELDEYIESIDTSNPIVAGIMGKKYEPSFGLTEKWSVKLVDFIDAELSETQVAGAFYNVAEFRNICR